MSNFCHCEIYTHWILKMIFYWWVFYWILFHTFNMNRLLLKTIHHWDFPGGSVVKTPWFQCRRHRFNFWLGNWDPTCCAAKTKQNKSIHHSAWILSGGNMQFPLCQHLGDSYFLLYSLLESYIICSFVFAFPNSFILPVVSFPLISHFPSTRRISTVTPNCTFAAYIGLFSHVNATFKSKLYFVLFIQPYY